MINPDLLSLLYGVGTYPRTCHTCAHCVNEDNTAVDEVETDQWRDMGGVSPVQVCET